MPVLTEQSFWLFGAILGMGWLIALWAFVALRRTHAQLDAINARLDKDLGSLQSGAVRLGQRVLALEKRLLQTGSADMSGVDARSYTEATHLLDSGLDLDEVASRCGLSRAETSLLDTLRKRSG
ncbi:MAG TPA: DUF2802 domain-containing protein [Cellvibrionaceae bacterium]